MSSPLMPVVVSELNTFSNVLAVYFVQNASPRIDMYSAHWGVSLDAMAAQSVDLTASSLASSA